MTCQPEVHQGLSVMAKELNVNWSEIERAVIAGVPQRQVAQTMGESSGVDPERLYKAIRKRASRERWPIPASIIRRAQLQGLVASGQATNAKEAACWKQGEPGWETSAACAAMARQPVLSVEELDKQKDQSVTLKGSDCGEVSGGAEVAVGLGGVNGAGGGLPTAPVTATDLVTADLVTLGNRGLRAILNRATQRAEAMTEAPEVRSWQDVQTMTKVISQAAGLDKPQVALSVSLNSGLNSGIAGWEAVETIDTITERVG